MTTAINARLKLAALAVAATAAVSTPPASAFDAGPHTDLTRDALTSEGFSATAADVGVVENWFVDYYWNAKANPFSGHAGLKNQAAGGARTIDIEFWEEPVIKGTDHMHFDSSEFPDLGTTAGIDAEWQRMIKSTRNVLATARREQDPLTVVAALGMSLHTVQDFYAHTNWVETKGELGSPDGPGWSREYGGFPTYFDIVRGTRLTQTLYSGVRTSSRGHGKWQTDHNHSLAHGLNKDWPGRPLYQKAYVTSYFASRQWIRAARTWLGDDALWERAKRLGQPRGLRSDLQASFDVSRYSGHWQGNGEPCKNGVVKCGELKGAAGSVLGLRAAIKHYHEDFDVSAARRRFEQLAPEFRHALGGPRVAEPESSRDIQARTRFVQVQIPRMRGYDWALGDPGPDEADLYTRAVIRGQAFESTVIHGHDRFGFPAPYGATTWIRSVPVGWQAVTPVSTLTVNVKTGDERFAGTDDDVFVRVNDTLRFPLEKRAYDDFERGDDDTYAVALDDLTRRGLTVGDIAYAQIEKSSDGPGGGWLLQSFAMNVNGNFVAAPTVRRWLEDGRRTFRAPVRVDTTPRDVVPVWLHLDEDDYLFGGDDTGDVNELDRNTAVAFGYVPGPEVVRDLTGGDRHSGRLSLGNGEKGQIRTRVTTIAVVPPPVKPADPAETPTPTPSPGPTPTVVPGPADLVITAFDGLAVTVRNRGGTPTGAFTITATGYSAIQDPGLAPGQSRTYRNANPCVAGRLVAEVDSGKAVPESDEANNTAAFDSICLS